MVKHQQLALPKKDQRQALSRSKYTVEKNKSHEASKACVDCVFASSSNEDASLESLIDNTEIFSFSEEIHGGGQILESAKNFVECAIPSASTPSSLSSAITAHKDEAGKLASSDSDSGINSFLEVEMVINHLREARLQVLNSVTVDGGSKSIVDSLIHMVISNLDGMSGENTDRYRLPNLVTGKTHILLLLFATSILAALMLLLFSTTTTTGSFTGPPPT